MCVQEIGELRRRAEQQSLKLVAGRFEIVATCKVCLRQFKIVELDRIISTERARIHPNVVTQSRYTAAVFDRQ